MQKQITILVIVALVVGGLSFYGGMQYANGSKTAARTAGQSQNGTGANGGRSFRGGGGGSGFVSGQILSKDNTSITVKLRNGGSTIVFTSPNTTVMKSVPGSLSDLAIGQEVMVTGTTTLSGVVTAESVQVRPSILTNGQ